LGERKFQLKPGDGKMLKPLFLKPGLKERGLSPPKVILKKLMELGNNRE